MTRRRCAPYTTYAIGDNGERTRLRAHGLVLERPMGVDLAIDIAPPPTLRGHVGFSTFHGSFVLEPGGGDVVYLFMEDWPRGDPRRGVRRDGRRTPLGHVYAVNARGEKSAIPHRSFSVELREDLELRIDLAPPAPWARHVCVFCEVAPLAISLRAANVFFVSIDGLR